MLKVLIIWFWHAEIRAEMTNVMSLYFYNEILNQSKLPLALPHSQKTAF